MKLKAALAENSLKSALKPRRYQIVNLIACHFITRATLTFYVWLQQTFAATIQTSAVIQRPFSKQNKSR